MAATAAAAFVFHVPMFWETEEISRQSVARHSSLHMLDCLLIKAIDPMIKHLNCGDATDCLGITAAFEIISDTQHQEETYK